MKSNILIHITKESEIQGKKIVSDEYITDLFVYTKMPKVSLLFRKDTKKLYTVDEEQKKLIETKTNDLQVSQIRQVKSMIMTMDIQESEVGEKKKYKIEGKGNSIAINGEVMTIRIKGLEETINHLVYQDTKKTSLFELSLEEDELIENSFLTMNIQGNAVQSKTITTSIRVIENNRNEFDHIYNYHLN
ncbi:MAG TPA: hypothetical protein VD908_16960 [Cytophagales bacterium]|nr:hypothetical protein [Cytophagales bacterium]